MILWLENQFEIASPLESGTLFTLLFDLTSMYTSVLKEYSAQYYYLEEAYSNTDGTFTLGERIYNRLREKEQIMLNAIENQVLEKVTSTEEDLNLIFSGLGLS